MRFQSFLAVLFLLLQSLFLQSTQQSILLIEDVTVIDVVNRQILKHQDVIIDGSFISSITEHIAADNMSNQENDEKKSSLPKM
jgi:hypothetical protein